MKYLIGIESIMIGINEWFIPQISEHCPKKDPDLLEIIEIWFNRPGVASILIPKEGIVHEWITSVDVIINRIWQLIGIGVELSTSKNRIILEGFI